jgi:hemolysin III
LKLEYDASSELKWKFDGRIKLHFVAGKRKTYMIKTQLMPHYSKAEEMLNVTSHALGIILSIAAMALLLSRAIGLGSPLHIASFGIFGASLVFLYGSSTVYHSTKNVKRRAKLRILDHISIYLLIAGTYTPFTLITLQGRTGWLIFGACWTMALTGTVLKLFFTGKFRLLSTLMYVLMGWLILFAMGPLIERFPSAGLSWLVAGGLAYTFGAVLYSIKKVPFNHAIFHLFVLVGSSCHFCAVYFYVV